MKKDSGDFSTSPYGNFETMMSTVIGHLDKFSQKGPFWLGYKFTAVDVLWGSAWGWIMGFELIPKHPLLEKYLSLFSVRPSVKSVAQKDLDFLKKLE